MSANTYFHKCVPYRESLIDSSVKGQYTVITRKGQNYCKGERDRQKRRNQTKTEKDSYDWTPYLFNLIVSLNSGPYALSCLAGSSLLPLQGTHCLLSESLDWLTTFRPCLWALVYLIYIAPTYSFRFSFQLSIHVIYFRCFLVHTVRTSCLWNPK